MGSYRVEAEVSPEHSRERSRLEYEREVVVLFNPWCKGEGWGGEGRDRKKCFNCFGLCTLYMYMATDQLAPVTHICIHTRTHTHTHTHTHTPTHTHPHTHTHTHTHTRTMAWFIVCDFTIEYNVVVW